MELLDQFCCWHLFGLTCHWAWLAGDIFTIEISLIDWVTLYITPVVVWSLDMRFLFISLLMLYRCMCPFYQATLLRHRSFYLYVWSLSSHSRWWMNYSWIETKQNSSSLGVNGSGAKIVLYVFSRAFRCGNKPEKLCSESCINLWQKVYLPLSHTWGGVQFILWPYPGALVFSVIADTWVWTLQIYWLMLWCLATLITEIVSGIADEDLQSSGCPESTGPCYDGVATI